MGVVPCGAHLGLHLGMQRPRGLRSPSSCSLDGRGERGALDDDGAIGSDAQRRGGHLVGAVGEDNVVLAG